jgi:uncharacterized protein (UPF0332 family)
MKNTQYDYIKYRFERARKTFEDANSHTHSGAKTQLSLHFVKTGKLEKEFGMLYGDLFDLRQKGDYGDFFDFEEQHITKLIPKVEEFLQKIEDLTNQ